MFAMEKEKVGHQDANPITQMIWANTLLTVFLAIPSLSVMVLLRRKIGYRTLQPWMLLIVFGGLFAAGFLHDPPAPPKFLHMVAHLPTFLSGFSMQDDLPIYFLTLTPFIVTGLGFYQRRAAWNRIGRERWHTKSRGTSHLSAIFNLPEHIVQRFAEPIVCLIAGIGFSFISRPTGLWLAFSGGCLFWMEALIYDLQLNNALDQLDAQVESDVAAENHAFFSGELTGEGKDVSPPSIEQMAGIMVGFSPELERQIAQRRAAKAAHSSHAVGATA